MLAYLDHSGNLQNVSVVKVTAVTGFRFRKSIRNSAPRDSTGAIFSLYASWPLSLALGDIHEIVNRISFCRVADVRLRKHSSE
jgi:hypothetical protein